MGVSCQSDVVPQDTAVIRVRAVFDDRFGSLRWALTAQVGYPLFGDDDLNRMFAVVQMTDQGNDRADFAALGGRRACEDRQKGVAGEITGTTDSVHHAAA